MEYWLYIDIELVKFPIMHLLGSWLYTNTYPMPHWELDPTNTGDFYYR